MLKFVLKHRPTSIFEKSWLYFTFYSKLILPQRASLIAGVGSYMCACLLEFFFVKFGIAIRGFSSELKEPKLHNLGVFWANYCKKHPMWSKWFGQNWVLFFWKRYTDGWEIRQKIGIEKSDFQGPAGTSTYNFCESNAPRVTSCLDIGNTPRSPDQASSPQPLSKYKAARIITCTKPTEHISPVLRDLHWLPI